MFENLSEKLERSFKVLKGQGRITEINVASTLKEVRRALVDADVSYPVAKKFVDDVKAKAMGQNVINAVNPSQLMVKIVHDELAALMGGEESTFSIEGNPAVILMSGLQGSGKTTFTGKLANRLKSGKEKRKPLLVACDVYRPAAIEQLKTIAEQIDVPVYSEPESKDPVRIALNAIEHAKSNGYDLVIVDTAGRLAVDEAAVNTAKAFNERLDFDGVVLTKLDGDTRGGAALSIRAVVDKPIKFVGIGEKMTDLDPFRPAGMADRILGMGDIVSFVDRMQQQYDEAEAEKLEKKIKQNKFDFDDFLKQIKQIKKMGNLKSLASMIPGVGKAIKDIDIPDDAFKGVEAIIGSMTPQERSNPDIIDASRRKRIAKGSGTSVEEVNRLLKQFLSMRKVMHQVSTNPMQMMRAAKANAKGQRHLR